MFVLNDEDIEFRLMTSKWLIACLYVLSFIDYYWGIHLLEYVLLILTYYQLLYSIEDTLSIIFEDIFECACLHLLALSLKSSSHSVWTSVFSHTAKYSAWKVQEFQHFDGKDCKLSNIYTILLNEDHTNFNH